MLPDSTEETYVVDQYVNNRDCNNGPTGRFRAGMLVIHNSNDELTEGAYDQPRGQEDTSSTPGPNDEAFNYYSRGPGTSEDAAILKGISNARHLKEVSSVSYSVSAT